MKRLFNSVKVTRPKTNIFDLSHEKKMSLNMGELVPFFVQECVPGDKWRAKSEIMMRLAPMVAPVMHRVNVYTHYFFVPNRIIWNEWEDFITGGVDGQSMPAFPQVQLGEANKFWFAPGQLPDYMGAPTCDPTKTLVNSLVISQLPFRAYQMIYNEYYRDQNLIQPIDIPLGSGFITAGTGPDANLFGMRKRAWEKDYFTSALPWAQRGGDVLIPFADEITYKSVSTIHDQNGVLSNTQGALTTTADGKLFIPDASGQVGQLQNLESVTGDVTINELRKAIRLQEWLEKNARAGSRYIEQILSHFGVKSSDARLQRPEYIGGGKQPVVISEVLSSYGTDAGMPLGEMGGHGISVGSSNQFTKFIEEHGYIIGIMSVLPRTAYQNGVEKHLTKFDKFDYFWPEFAHLGEQEIKDKELYVDFEAPGWGGEGTFGYTPRYAEYKFAQSKVHGDFKTSLEFWHMGRSFATKPALNEEFVTSDPTHRIFAVTDELVDKLYTQIYNDVRVSRPMPVFGTPML